MKAGWTHAAYGKVLYASSNGDLAFGKRVIDDKNHFVADGGWVEKVGYQGPTAYYLVEPYAVQLDPEAFRMPT